MITQVSGKIRLLAVASCLAIAGLTNGAWADSYAQQWAPPVGTPMPVLDASDHTGTARNFENLAGENGLLIFLNRSADW